MRVRGIESDRRCLISTSTIRHCMVAVVLLPLLGGCAGDYVRRDNTSVAAEAYQADLNDCQSSAAAAKAAGGAEGVLVGALIGAAHGAVVGANHGGADVGAAIGASIGAVISFAEGLA